MKDIKPLISLLLSVENAEAFLEKCLESVLNQSYPNIEIIAIDDFSKDNSYKILKQFRKIDKRIKISQNVKKYGKAITLNRAIRKAKGTFIAFMDAEDIAYKERLRKQLIFLQNNPKIVAVGTQCTFISEKNKRLGVSEFPLQNDTIYNKPLHGISMQFESVMINKLSLPKDIISFNPSAPSFLYTDLFLKLLQYGELSNLPLPLQFHRKHEDSNTSLITKIPSFAKLLVKSFPLYDYRPSIRSILLSPFKQPDFSTQ